MKKLSLITTPFLAVALLASAACDKTSAANPVGPTPDPPVQVWPDGASIVTRTIAGVVTEDSSSVCAVTMPSQQDRYICLGEIAYKITIPGPQGHGAAEWHFTWSPAEPGNEPFIDIWTNTPYLEGLRAARGSAGELHSLTFTGSPLGIPDANVEYRVQVLHAKGGAISVRGKTNWMLAVRHSQ